MKKFYITTAIPYVNAAPHLGFALELVQTDVIARYYKKIGEDVYFVTGSDENSLKNVQSAEEEKISIKELVNRNSQKFFQLKDVLNISWDDFIRTTEERHIKGAQKLWQSCKKEDIYKKKYKGLYCVGCEAFYTEKDLVKGLCPDHRVKPEVVEEENYFFKLSNYQKELEKLISSDKLKIVPETRKNEVLTFIKSGLEDFSISRSNQRAKNWGIAVPGDDSQKIYVWFDALSNYINALGYAEDNELFKRYWEKNDNILHVIGKGIIRFHAIYWPAILLSAGLNLPKTIFVHGYLTINGQKISKSLGNIIDPFETIKKYGADSVRYYLLREIPAYEDGDFSIERFKERYNADLAKGIGNLVARVITLAKNSNYQFSIPGKFTTPGFSKIFDKNKKASNQTLEEFKFNESLKFIWNFITFCDKYIEKNKVWKASRDQKKQIGNLLAAIEEIAKLLQPFLPETSEKIKEQIKTGKSEVLFPRI